MRLFLAIELDEAVRAAAGRVANLLEGRLTRAAPGLDARWIAPPNLHITLWFLGEVCDTRRPEITAALGRAFRTAPFTLEIAGAGAFPSPTRPRVFWLGVSRGRDGLIALHEEVAERLTPLGYPRDARPYAPHLTVARVRSARAGSGSAIAAAVASMPAECGAFQVGAVTLFRSRLSPRGARYEPLLRVPLT